MAKKTVTLTADTTGVFVASVKRRVDAQTYKATVLAYGTWGGGTISWKLSPDNGTTLVALKDLTGTAITSSADDNFSIELGNSSKNSESLKIYAVLAGSTNPSLTLALYDNN